MPLGLTQIAHAAVTESVVSEITEHGHTRARTTPHECAGAAISRGA